MADVKNETQAGYEAGRAPVRDAAHSTAEYPQIEYPDETGPDREQPTRALRDRESSDRDRDDRDDRDRDRNSRPGFPTRALRGLFWLVATVGLVLALVVGAQSVGWLPKFKNPFAAQTTDRSQPPLLQSIQDLSRYVAAEGNFQVIIDVKQDHKYIPDFLVNDRILFVAAGGVEAYVEFGNMAQGAIQESADRRSVTVTLPAPGLGKPNLDPNNTYVYTQDRGLLNRVKDAFSNDPNRMQEVYKLAEERIAAAATDSSLRDRAQENTRKMLTGMLRSLGYTDVTVKYEAG